MTKTSFLCSIPCSILALFLVCTGCADLSQAEREAAGESPGIETEEPGDQGRPAAEEPSGEGRESRAPGESEREDGGRGEAADGGEARPLESEEEVAGRERKPEREPVLSVYQARRMAGRMIRPPLYTIQGAGRPIVHLEDLDLDGVPEVLVPCVYSEESVDTSRFSDFSRLFQEDAKAYPFYFYTFLMKDGRLSQEGRVGLGSRFVYGGIARVRIIRGREKPFVIVVTFQTHEGEEQEWLAYTGRSIFPSSRLSLRETISTSVIVEDIDEDDRIDVVVQEKGSEEGTGMETFLTWYRWNGRSFAEAATTNVVRNLKSFLVLVRKLVEEQSWDRLAEVCFRPQDSKVFFGRGMSTEDIVIEAFGLGEYYDTGESSPSEILDRVQQIVFPEFLENPFIAKDDMGWYFRLTFRILDSEGITIVNEIPLYMQKNPFLDRQFFFRLEQR